VSLAPQTISVFSTDNGQNLATLQELASDFTSVYPNVTVNVAAPADGGTVLKADLTKNQLPDVIVGGGDSNFLMLQQAGVLDDLSSQPYMSNVQQAYVQQVTSMYSESGVFGVPYAVNAEGLLYNKDAFTSAGISAAPTTWTQFTQDVATLAAKGVTPLGMGVQGGDNWTLASVWNSVAQSLQPANFGQDRLAGKTTFAADMGPSMQKFLDVLKLAQPGFNGASLNSQLADFAQGKTAMLINGSWELSSITQLNSNVNIGLVPFPTTDTASQNYLTSGIDALLAVVKSSTHQDAAQAFVSFMMQPAQAQKYASEQLDFPAVIGVTQSNPTMVEAASYIAQGQVTAFPDHLYPAGFSEANYLSQAALNLSNGMDDATNISQTLAAMDSAYNSANVQQ